MREAQQQKLGQNRIARVRAQLNDPNECQISAALYIYAGARGGPELLYLQSQPRERPFYSSLNLEV